MKRLHVRLVGLLGGIVAGVVVLFVGIWLGGPPERPALAVAQRLV